MSEAEMNGQLESVCESVFSETEVQAMDALGLPGCFRTRSHSYLRAIQAGYSQDDECGPTMLPPTAMPSARPMAGKGPPTPKPRPVRLPPPCFPTGTITRPPWGRLEAWLTECTRPPSGCFSEAQRGFGGGSAVLGRAGIAVGSVRGRGASGQRWLGSSPVSTEHRSSLSRSMMQPRP